MSHMLNAASRETAMKTVINFRPRSTMTAGLAKRELQRNRSHTQSRHDHPHTRGLSQPEARGPAFESGYFMAYAGRAMRGLIIDTRVVAYAQTWRSDHIVRVVLKMPGSGFAARAICHALAERSNGSRN